MVVEIDGEEHGVKYRDNRRSFRIRVTWESGEGDSEAGRYYAERYLSNKVDLPEGEHLNERRKVTHAVIEEAIETILDETAQDDAVFVDAEVIETRDIRQVGSLL